MDWIGAPVRAALPMAISLMLAAAPQEARAGACKAAGFRGTCVESKDIANASLRAVDFKDESQGYFALGQSVLSIPSRFKIYAEVVLTPPADGFLIVTASAYVTVGDSSDGTVRCTLNIGRATARAKNLSIFADFSGSANNSTKAFDSFAISKVREVNGGKARKVAMLCFLRTALGQPVPDVNIFRPALTVVFHPIRY